MWVKTFFFLIFDVQKLCYLQTEFFLNGNYTLSFNVLNAIFPLLKRCVNHSPDDIPKKNKPDLKKSCSLRSLFDTLTVNSHMYALQTVSELSTQIM